MIQDEKYTQLKRKVFENIYSAEELEQVKQAFLQHESVCFDMDNLRQFSLFKKLCAGIEQMMVLPLCLHLPREQELLANCLLVINTGDQEDFKRVAGRAAKALGVARFFHTLPDSGKVYSKEIVATEDGWDLKNLRTAKLLIDGRDRYLVLRPRSLNRKD